MRIGTLRAILSATRSMAGNINFRRGQKMNNLLIKMYVKFQDLVEYALVVALIAFGATAGMKALAGGINVAFSNVSGALATNIT